MNEETQILSWNAVEKATAYEVTVESNGTKTFTVNEASIDLKEFAGNISITVTPKAWGYNSPEAASYTYAKQILATPSNVVIEGNVLSWVAVAGASGYEVKVGDVTKTTNSLTLDLSSVTGLAAGEYDVAVRALGNPSAWSNALSVAYQTFTAENLAYENGVLSWDAILGASEYTITLNGSTVATTPNTSAEIAFTQAGANTLTVTATANGQSYTATLSVTTYAVAFNVQGGTAISTAYYAVGDEIALPEATKTSFEFVGWYNGTLPNARVYADNVLTVEEAKDITVYARYIGKKHQITLVSIESAGTDDVIVDVR